jgi:flagellar hook-associated protein 1
MPLGLFGSLSMANRSLQTQRQGTETAGHNLANVNTPGYSRQRVAIETSIYVPGELGPQGTGADAVAIRQIRDVLLDRQITGETSVRGAHEAKQRALQFMQSALGQVIDQQSSGAEAAAAANGGGQNGVGDKLSDLFNAFQSVSVSPTSTTERQVLLIKAQSLATQFNQVAQRLTNIGTSLDDSLSSDVKQANATLADIAKLNEQIINAEIDGSTANDLRDIRQLRIEDLAKITKIQSVENSNGGVDISIDGVTVVSGPKVLDTLETYDAGGGQMLVRTATGATPLNVAGGSMHGIIEARDMDLQFLRDNIDTLASNLISQVNAIHSTGYGLDGSTGEIFFTGSTAADIGINSVLVNDPGRIQASGQAGAVGNNTVVLQLAQLAETRVAALGNQTFTENYGGGVAQLGQSLSGVNTQLSNQQIVEKMLTRQRDSVSGVSLDEEMTDLIKYQRAFEASARLITTIDELLQTVVNLKR